MKNEKHTDELIRQKLENFAVIPPPRVWENVQKGLAARKQKTRIVYMRWVAAAAVLLLAMVAGWYFGTNTNSPELANAKKEQVNHKSNALAPATSKTEINNTKSIDSFNKNLLVASTQGNNLTNIQTGTSPKFIVPERKLFEMKYLSTKSVRIAAKEIQVINLPPQATGRQITPEELSQIDRLIIAENIRAAQPREKETDRWKMGMFVSPGYSDYNASYDKSYSRNMSNSSGHGNTNIGGGMSVQYKTGKRWMIESGVYYAQNEQSTGGSSNMFASNTNYDFLAGALLKEYNSNIVTVQNGNVAMNSIAGVIQLNSTPRDATIMAGLESAKTGVSNLVVPASEFTQQFEFMEIPVYIRYRVLDKRFGIELLTGFNSGILIGNQAYIENDNGIQDVGKTMDISAFNISGTAGIGANYAFGKHISVSVEPRFSYYLNSVNNSGLVDFRPYRIGIYTGITYGF